MKHDVSEFVSLTVTLISICRESNIILQRWLSISANSINALFMEGGRVWAGI